MKNIRFRMAGLVFALFVCCVLAGCSNQCRSRVVKGSLVTDPDAWRRIDPTHVSKLVVASSAADGDSFTNRVIISEVAFVQSLYNDLAHQETHVPKPWLWIGPKLFVFVDGQDDLLCSFLYWPAGNPEHIFVPCEAKRADSAYRVERPASRTPSVALPGFGERIRQYVDVWE